MGVFSGLLAGFRCQASAKGSPYQKLAAVLENVHAYYNQFLPLVETAIKENLAPIEKRLEVGHMHTNFSYA